MGKAKRKKLSAYLAIALVAGIAVVMVWSNHNKSLENRHLETITIANKASTYGGRYTGTLYFLTGTDGKILRLESILLEQGSSASGMYQNALIGQTKTYECYDAYDYQGQKLVTCYREAIL